MNEKQIQYWKFSAQMFFIFLQLTYEYMQLFLEKNTNIHPGSKTYTYTSYKINYHH